MTFTCTYSKKRFTSKGNLITHQKTAKFCLEIQKIVMNTMILKV